MDLPSEIKPSEQQRQYFENDRPLWLQWLANEISDDELLDNVYDRLHYARLVIEVRKKRQTQKKSGKQGEDDVFR